MKRGTLFSPRTSLRASLGLVVLASTLVLSSVVPASAGGRSVEAGSCTGTTNWKLSVEGSRRSVSVTLRITGSPPRRSWTVFLDNDGWGFYSGTRRADGRGALVLRRNTSNGPGPDRVTVAATDRATGETCAGTVVYR